MSKLLLLSVVRSGGGLATMLGGMGGRGPPTMPTIGLAPANGGRGWGGPTAGRICGGKTKFCGGGRTYSGLGILWSLEWGFGLGEKVGLELLRERVRSLGGAL